MVTSPSSAASDGLLITKVASLVVRFAWRCFVDSFIHRNGNDNAAVITLWRVRDSAEGAEPMCALPRRQSWLREEGSLARQKASPSLSAWSLEEFAGDIHDAFSRRGPSPREKPLAKKRGTPREARQAWRAWSLAKPSEGRCGPWQAGPWYPGIHCADSSPRAHDGHAEVANGGEASRAQRRLPGP